MNPEIKAEWTRRLRSGAYVQGYTWLRKGSKYCCLGVLCEIAVEQGVIPKPLKDVSGLFTYVGLSKTLPVAVIGWANTIGPNGWLRSPRDGQDNLAQLNDSGMSFGHIADVIDEQF